MKALIYLLGAVISLSACSTVEVVRKDQTPEKKELLRYSPSSSESKEAKYREKVDKKARDYCGGDYKVTHEYQALEESGVGTGVGLGTGFGIGGGGGGFGLGLGAGLPSYDMYQFVEIACK